MPTFSSVVHKPGRKVAAPKVVPRRNAQRPGSTRASAASTPAQSPHPGSNTSAIDPKGNVPDAAQPAPPSLIQTGNSVQVGSNDGRARTGAIPDIQREIPDKSPVLETTNNATTAGFTILQPGRAITHPMSAPVSQARVAGTQSNAPAQSQEKISSVYSSRKRKAGELDSSTPQLSNTQLSDTTQRQAGIPAVEQSIPTRHITPDTALPSIETDKSALLAAKAKRAAPKPRAQPRPKEAIQAITKNAGLQNSDNNAQQTRRSNSIRQHIQRAPSAAQSEADALLQDVTSQFSAVSRLADGIDGTSRAAILARSGSNLTGSAQTTSSLANALNRATHRQTQARTAADLAAEIIGEAVGADIDVVGNVPGKPKRKRRKRNPDDTEEHVIDPAETKMGDLTRDTGLGKKSGIEMALENVDWKAVKQQQKEMAEETAKQQEFDRQEKRSGKPKKRKKAQGEKPAEALVPKMAVVNGVIVSVAESREIDIRQDAEADAARDDANVITIDKLTMRKNQNTIGKPKGLQGKQLQWSEEMDERFYKGVRMFGADMLMLSSLFPKLERRHVKKKFVREERAHPEKLREALFNPIVLDDQTYQAETGMELGDPRKLEQELKEMEADLRKRFEESMAEQGAGAHHEPVVLDDADVPLPSREVDDEVEAGGVASTGRGRFDDVADGIIDDAMGGRGTGLRKGKRKAGPVSTNMNATAALAMGAGARKKKDGTRSSMAAVPRKGTKAAKEAAALLQLGGTVEEIGVIDG